MEEGAWGFSLDEAAFQDDDSEARRAYRLFILSNLELRLRNSRRRHIELNTPICRNFRTSGFCTVSKGGCRFLHKGDMCRFCGLPALHPFNKRWRNHHQKRCFRNHEKYQDYRNATEKSEDKQCGICLDVVWSKTCGGNRFGILPNCMHCFCLDCIMKWRRRSELDFEEVKSCPVCRVRSRFVCPSHFWVDDEESKKKFIQKYKATLKQKDCRYFKKGYGNCKFGDACFYRHVFTNGEEANLGPPAFNRGTTFWGLFEPRIRTLGASVEQLAFFLEDFQEFSDEWTCG